MGVRDGNGKVCGLEMRRKRYNRRKRLARTLIVRGMAGVLLVGVVFAVVCVGLYARDVYWKEEETMTETGSGVAPSVAATEAEPEESEGEEPLEKITFPLKVMLDAGHGGNDSGTFYETTYEKDITLEVTKKMKALLEEQGVEVVLTRESDKYMGLKERTELSREEDPDVFVSIHCNSFEDDSSVAGIECYYWEDDEEGEAYAESLMDAAEEIEALRIRGTRVEDYYVIRFNDAPAVLVEMGYLSNSADRARLIDEGFQQTLAEKLVQGILEEAERQQEE